MIQRTLEHVVVRIVPTEAWTPGHSVRLRHIVNAFFEREMQVDVELVERIPRPSSGKVCDTSLG